MAKPCTHPEPVEGCNNCLWWHSPTAKGRNFRLRFGGPALLPGMVLSAELPPGRQDSPVAQLLGRAGVTQARPSVARFLKPLPCVHRGAETGETRACPTCNQGSVPVPLLACAVKGVCTTSKLVSGVECCRVCKDRVAPPVPPAELLPGFLDPIPDPEEPSPRGWADLPHVRERHVNAFRSLLAAELPPPARAEGDGVVIVGGGKYWPMIVVSVRMLRDVSTLPVQIWHRGEEEPITPTDLADVPGVTFHDATKVSPTPRILRGWEAKGVALLHCGLRRVLYLDADAYCVSDPSPLLDLATQRRFVFWSDMPHCDNNLKWEAYGLDPALREKIPTVQGGQYALDRLAFWREVVLFHWLNQHSEWAYSHSYGDQDQWRAVLAATAQYG